MSGHRVLDLEALVLERSSHEYPEEGMCVMEAVAFVAGEPHSDSPSCVSPIISAFLRRWNDDLPDAERQRLKPYIPRLVGTRASDQVENRRAWMVTDWMVRLHIPAWLELAGMRQQAAAVRALDPILSASAVADAQPLLKAVRADSAAARAAAGAAAWAAARDAARAAAREKLKPTVADLQASAFGLLDALIEVAS